MRQNNINQPRDNLSVPERHLRAAFTEPVRSSHERDRAMNSLYVAARGGRDDEKPRRKHEHGHGGSSGDG